MGTKKIVYEIDEGGKTGEGLEKSSRGIYGEIKGTLRKYFSLHFLH